CLMSVTNRKLLLPIIALLVVASSMGLVASIPAAHAQVPTVPSHFSVSVSPSTVNNLPTFSASGSTGSATVTVSAQNGFQGTVTLSTSVSPSSGLIVTLGKTSFIFNATNPTTQTTTLTLNGTSVGNYVVRVTG